MKPKLKHRFMTAIVYKYDVASIEESTRLLLQFDGRSGLDADTIKRDKDSLFLYAKGYEEKDEQQKTVYLTPKRFVIATQGMKFEQFKRFRSDSIKHYLNFNRKMNLKTIDFLDNSYVFLLPPRTISNKKLKMFVNNSIFKDIMKEPFTEFFGFEFRLDSKTETDFFKIDIQSRKENIIIFISLPIYNPLKAGFNKHNIKGFTKKSDQYIKRIIGDIFDKDILSFEDI